MEKQPAEDLVMDEEQEDRGICRALACGEGNGYLLIQEGDEKITHTLGAPSREPKREGNSWRKEPARSARSLRAAL